MPVEVEAKIKVDSHDAVRARLAALRAMRICRVLETNHIFDSPDRTLLSGGRGLRIRTCRAEDGNNPPSTLTYKGPRIQGPLKTREEIEVSIDDGEAGRQLVEALGYIEVLCFEKRRETWRVGDCTIELDEVPHLGRFVEIEGPDEAAVLQAKKALGFGDCETIRRSYISLLIEYCKQAGKPADRIVFTDGVQRR